MHCGQVGVQHVCLPRYVWPHLDSTPSLNPSAFRVGELRGPGLLLEWGAHSVPLAPPAPLCVLRTAQTDEGFCSALAGRVFHGVPPECSGLGPRLASMLRAWSPIRGRGGESCVSLQTDLGDFSPVTGALKWRARAPGTPLIPEDGVPSSLGAQSCRAEAHRVGQPPRSAASLCRSAECSVTGDIHFTTFDGRRYTFPATCQYILAKSRSSGTFTVTLQNAPCGLVRAGTPGSSQPAAPDCRLLERLGL